jgi:glycosyltransferase involved in cell wall biosynthesis
MINTGSPLVSIKIASYNHARFIVKTIQSVLDQSYQNFELIIVDDCSEDESLEVIKSFTDSRIRVIVNKKNIGASASSRKAKVFCSGKYFCSLDSDDYFHPDKLATQVAYMERHPDIDLVGTYVQEVDESGNMDLNQATANWFNTSLDFNQPESWIWQNHLCHSSVLIKKNVHDQVWDYESCLRHTNDWSNWIRLLASGAKFHVIPEQLTYYRRHPENTTFKNLERSLWEYAYISAKTLHPYLSRTQRHDLLYKNLEKFFIDERYPSDLDQRLYFLHLLMSDEVPGFEQIWRQRYSTDLELNLDSSQMDELQVADQLRLQLAAKECHVNTLREELRLAESKIFKWARLRNVWNEENFSLNKLLKLTYIAFQSCIPDAAKWVFRPIYKTVMRHLRTLKNPASPNPYQAQIAPLSSQPERILHVIANFVAGGSSQLVVDIMAGLGEKYGQQVLTAHSPFPCAYQGVPIHEYRGEQEIRAFIREFRPDLVHVHYWGGANWAWYDKVFEAIEQTGCKVIENVNTPVTPYRNPNVQRYVYVSEYVRKNFGHVGESAQVIYPGTDTNFYARRELDATAKHCIGMVYRLEPDKLNEQAMDVFIEVVRQRPGATVLIVGDGKLLPGYRKKVADHCMEKAFSFVGARSYAELPGLYAQMDIFVAPVWKESFGQVSCFAMSMGIPVVGYKVGGLREIVGDDDLLVTPGDGKALATLIISLLDDADRRKAIGQRNRQRVHELFSVDRMVEKYAALYSDLINVQ